MFFINKLFLQQIEDLVFIYFFLGIRNPIQVACKLLEKELQGPSMSGLIPPCFLAGEGAFNWALEHGFSGCCDDDLITEVSKLGINADQD